MDGYIKIFLWAEGKHMLLDMDMAIMDMDMVSLDMDILGMDMGTVWIWEEKIICSMFFSDFETLIFLFLLLRFSITPGGAGNQ